MQNKLQAELDAAVTDAEIADYEKVKHLTYLDAVINESLRLYSTLGGGLPRVVPDGGLTILGQTFDAGTILSVPTYTTHRDTSVWGADVEEFRPERWLEGDVKEMQKAFAPFSIGPRQVASVLQNDSALIAVCATEPASDETWLRWRCLSSSRPSSTGTISSSSRERRCVYAYTCCILCVLTRLRVSRPAQDKGCDHPKAAYVHDWHQAQGCLAVLCT